jgi:hypothetical protein
MAAKSEAPSELEVLQMPTPGTLAHLEYLRQLKINDESHLFNPRIFLIETMAATSLARVIRRHRTYWPMRNMQTADLDSRLLALESERLGSLYGSIGLRSHWPSRNHLIMSGRPSSGNSYDLVIPVTRAYIYDPDQPVQAAYYPRDADPQIYNEIAAPRYNEHNPEALISVVQEAAGGILDILHHIYGQREGRAGVEAYPEVDVAWHPDYLNDNPDEFLLKTN